MALQVRMQRAGPKKHEHMIIDNVATQALSRPSRFSFLQASTYENGVIPMSTQSQLKPFSTSLHFFHVLSSPPNLPGTRDSLPALGTCHGIILITHVETPGQC